MQGRDFYDRVEEHAELEWLGARETAARGASWAPESDSGGGEVLVRHVKTDLKYALSLGAIGEHPWEELEAVLTGSRTARIMTHLTRIVGYYSRVKNWNRSKLAELRDRHLGAYSLPETGEAGAAPPGPARREEQAAVA